MAESGSPFLRFGPFVESALSKSSDENSNTIVARPIHAIAVLGAGGNVSSANILREWSAKDSWARRAAKVFTNGMSRKLVKGHILLSQL